MTEVLYFIFGAGVGSLGLLWYMAKCGYIQAPMEIEYACPNEGCTFEMRTNSQDEDTFRVIEENMETHVSLCRHGYW